MRRKEYILLFILSLIILFDMNGLLIFISSLAYYTYIYLIEAKEGQYIYGFFRIITLTLPFSFINIFGGSYGSLPLTWYNIIFIILLMIITIDIITFKEIDRNILSILSIIILLIIFLIFINSKDYNDSFSDLINNISPFILLYIGLHYRRKMIEDKKQRLLEDYIFGTLITSFGVIIQYMLIKTNILVLGNYQHLGSYREAFGYLFLDYSFLSLYIVSGALLFILNNGIKYKYIFVPIMLIASIITSARTGIVAFLLIYCLYSVGNVYKNILKGKASAILVLFVNILILMGSIIGIIIIRDSAATSDSGRNELNIIAFELFKSNPILGVGFGNETYISLGRVLPHNIIFQTLVQGGLIYFIPIITFLSVLLFVSYIRNKMYFLTISLILIGSLFIPNIFSSRFFGILLMLFGLSLNTKNN